MFSEEILEMETFLWVGWRVIFGISEHVISGISQQEVLVFITASGLHLHITLVGEGHRIQVAWQVQVFDGVYLLYLLFVRMLPYLTSGQWDIGIIQNLK